MVVYGRVFGVCTSVGSCTRVPKVGALQQAKFCSSDPCFTVLFASLFVQQDLAVRSCSEEISDVGSASRHTKHRIIMPGTRAQTQNEESTLMCGCIRQNNECSPNPCQCCICWKCLLNCMGDLALKCPICTSHIEGYTIASQEEPVSLSCTACAGVWRMPYSPPKGQLLLFTFPKQPMSKCSSFSHPSFRHLMKS